MLDQQRDVFDPLAQWRQAQANHVEAEVQVLAECAGRDLRLQFAVGRGDQPHIHARVRTVGADSLDLARFEETQQHDLHAHAHLADFVEKHRAVLRLLEEARLVAIGAREAPAGVAEQLRFQQRVRHAGAVDRDQRIRRAVAALMNETRDHFFADSGLARNQDLRIRASRALDIALNASDRLALANESDFRSR